MRRLRLLATDAAGFFGRLGYEAVVRSRAPAAIAASTQFAQLGPGSSILMSPALAARNRPGRRWR